MACDWEGEQQGFHHCWKELLAVERCLQVEGEKLAGLFLLLRVDASTTVRYIKMSLSWDEKWTWKHPLSIIFYCIYTFLSVLWIIFQLCRRFHCTKFELQSLAYSNTYRAFESDSEILD